MKKYLWTHSQTSLSIYWHPVNPILTRFYFFIIAEILYERTSSSIFSDFLAKFSFVNKRLVNFPDATKTLKMLHYHLGSKSEWSNEIGDVHLDESDNLGLTPKKTSQQVLSAFGAIIDCLEESRIG